MTTVAAGKGGTTRKMPRHIPQRIGIHLLLIVSSILIAFPFLWMATRALMTPEQLKLSRFALIPTTIQWSNFAEFWRAEPLFSRYFLNSATMALGVLALQMAVAALAAYAFTYVQFPGRNVLFFVAISTLMIPVVITYVPSYIILSAVPSWLRTAWALMLGAAGLFFFWLLLKVIDRTVKSLVGREDAWVGLAWRGVVLAVAVVALIASVLPQTAQGALGVGVQLLVALTAFLLFEFGDEALSVLSAARADTAQSVWRFVFLVGILTYVGVQGPHWLGETWLDTYQGLIIPSAVSAFGIFLFRQGFAGLPRELFDAGKIDGAGHLRMLADIVIPLSKPIIVTFVIFTVVQYYSSYFWPLLITNRPEMRVLTIGLQVFFIEKGYYGIRWHLIMAANTAAVLPLLILFFIAQRWFIEGVATTGIKG